MKKYSILVAAALASLTAFTSCDDKNECGCECSVPVITSVQKLDDTTHTEIAGAVEAGSYIAIQGSNLGEVTAIQFGNRIVSIKPAYRSANTLILQVPFVTQTCIGTLITGNCPTGYANNALNVVIGTPTVYMIYNEFAAEGELLKLKGSSFVGDQMYVDFLDAATGNLVATAGPENIQLIGETGDEMHVTVPAGVAHNIYLKVRNAAEGKESVCPIMFRDYRNMLTDFDAVQQYLYGTAAIEKDADGVYSIAGSDAKTAWTATAPTNYSPNGANSFGVFNNADDWQNLNFAPGAFDGDEPDIQTTSVFGQFLPEIQANPDLANNYVVKFEMFVDKDFPTNYMVYSFGFAGTDNTECGDTRQFSAALQMSKLNWDKSDPEAGWQYSSANDFSTNGWMTVTVPLTEFVWNLSACSYPGFAQNLTENNLAADADPYPYADSENQAHRNYVQVNAEAFNNVRRLGNLYGSFMIQINPYDGPENTSAKNKAAHIGIDNIRIVPNDGNGAIYPKLKYGEPSQHYYTNPRIKAFQ